MGELDKTIAVVFKRGGKNVMSEKEFVNSIIFNFRWTDSKGGFKLDARKAQMVLDAGIKKGFLTKQEGMVKTVFDYREFEVPMNYKPTDAILSEISEEAAVTVPAPLPAKEATEARKEPVPLPAEPPKATVAPPAEAEVKAAPPQQTAAQPSLFSRLVEDIVKASGLKRNEVVAKINKVQEKLGTASVVSAMALARDYGIDIAAYAKEAKEEVLRS